VSTEILKNSFGSVKPYTRHTQSCSHRDTAAHNRCNCPKWLYENRKGQAPSRRSLSTPSWAEAQRIAAQTLHGFDPEIAAARSAKVVREKQKMSVHDAFKLWIARAERENCVDGSLAQYRTMSKKLAKFAAGNGITAIQEITALQLEQWYSSREWTRYKDSTRSQRWGLCVACSPT
jgi:hypothetical protein